MGKVLTVVVPCFNEEDVLPETVKELGQVLIDLIKQNEVAADSKILFVDDGSKDQTWDLISQYTHEYDYVSGLKFSRNYGHQNALLAGMTVAVKKSDLIITIDADLQDDVQAIYEMVDRANDGYEVIYGVRNNRDTDTIFKRRTALGFYSFMERLGVKLVPNSADYRCLSQRATNELLKFDERNLFLRGMVPLIGFKTTKVYYARKERFAGTSKYPLRKMMSFAMDGITSFSVAPIHLIFWLGILTTVTSLAIIIYSIIQKFNGHVVDGWSSTMVSIWLLGGIQLISISVIGEYVGKIFTEVKHRPRYSIEEDLFS